MLPQPPDRLLLRIHFIDGLTIDEIGAMHDIHRATAARRIQKARERLAKLTKEKLRVRLGIDRWEADSVIRLVRSRLDFSVRNYLASGTAKRPRAAAFMF